MNGVINLNGYLSKQSLNRIKKHFYVYDKLYSYNFYEFEYLQLKSEFGKVSHYENVKLLVDQGFIEILENIDIKLLVNDASKPLAEFISKREVDYQDAAIEFRKKVERFYSKKCTQDDLIRADMEKAKIGWDLDALQERFYGLALSKKFNERIFPTLTLECFDAFQVEDPKSFIYSILVENIPIPDSSVPLVDIIQYRNESENQLRFKRLQSWVNKFAKENIDKQEIQQEIEYLIAEYRNHMELSGMKMNLIKLEFCCKILPHLFENLIRLKFSELVDPFFKLRYEKVALLKDEVNAKGNELAYIVNI